MAPRGQTDYSTEALLAEVDEELRQQQTEEETNLFVSVGHLRDFVKTEVPTENIFFSVIMCVLEVERLPNNRGTRVTLVDGFMQPHLKSYHQKLMKMDMFRKDARVFKVTVRDSKNRSVAKPRFLVGAVYEVKKIHGVKFYHNVLQGSVQAVGSPTPDIIVEFGNFESAKRARLDNNEEDNPNPGDEEQKEREEVDDEFEDML